MSVNMCGGKGCPSNVAATRGLGGNNSLGRKGSRESNEDVRWSQYIVYTYETIRLWIISITISTLSLNVKIIIED